MSKNNQFLSTIFIFQLISYKLKNDKKLLTEKNSI